MSIESPESIAASRVIFTISSLGLISGIPVRGIIEIKFAGRRLSDLAISARTTAASPFGTKTSRRAFSFSGVFLDIVKNPELSDLMERIHLEVVGMTVGERIVKQKERWKEEEIDYSQFELPTFERIRM